MNKRYRIKMSDVTIILTFKDEHWIYTKYVEFWKKIIFLKTFLFRKKTVRKIIYNNNRKEVQSTWINS